jgi:hypothetical protein
VLRIGKPDRCCASVTGKPGLAFCCVTGYGWLPDLIANEKSLAAFPVIRWNRKSTDWFLVLLHPFFVRAPAPSAGRTFWR